MAIAGRLTRAQIVARIAAHPLGETPDEMRAGFRRLTLGGGGRPDGGPRAFRPVEPVPGRPTILWFHGGGYVFGGPDTHARIGRHLSEVHGFEVRLPRYPLAPEHVWPAQRDQALAAADDAALDGRAPILAGDSAGGHLALVAALAMARAGTPATALLLFSPNTDRSGASATRAANAAADPMVDPKDDARLAAMCFGDRPGTDPEVSPLLDDLSLLPPTWIEVGAGEVLLDDSRLLAERGRAAGAEVTLTVTPDLLHMAQLWAPHWDAATESLDRAAAFATGVSQPRAET